MFQDSLNRIHLIVSEEVYMCSKKKEVYDFFLIHHINQFNHEAKKKRSQFHDCGATRKYLLNLQ